MTQAQTKNKEPATLVSATGEEIVAAAATTSFDEKLWTQLAKLDRLEKIESDFEQVTKSLSEGLETIAGEMIKQKKTAKKVAKRAEARFTAMEDKIQELSDGTGEARNILEAAVIYAENATNGWLPAVGKTAGYGFLGYKVVEGTVAGARKVAEFLSPPMLP